MLVFLVAYGLGFLAAIPLGGSQIEMAKRAIQGRLASARWVVLGSVSSDIFYGGLALFGIAPYLDLPWIQTSFNAAGAVILWGLSYLTYRMSRRPQELQMGALTSKRDRWAYLTGLLLSLSNPPMILTWLMGVTLLKRLGLASPFSNPLKVLFIVGGALGLATYPNIMAVVLYRNKHFIPVKALGRVYFWLGMTLFVLSFYFIYGVAKVFLIKL